MAHVAKTEPDFHCPTCGPVIGDITDSRPTIFQGKSVRWRRRKCPVCNVRHTTLEVSKERLIETEAQIEQRMRAKIAAEILAGIE